MALPAEDASAGAAHQRHLASLGLLSHLSSAHSGAPSSSSSSSSNVRSSADLTLVAFGREYAAHRLILVQAGFFNTLFCPVFREGCSSLRLGESSRIPIHFPDPNMSRPAWEFCLATLYGQAPRLRLPGWAHPRADHPLGMGFPLPPAPHLEDIGPHPEELGSEVDVFGMPLAQSHWATPRFLVSLLATSTYLAIPSVTSLALTYILASFTPYSVAAYVRFGSGLGIPPLSSLWDDDEESVDELDLPLTGWESLSTPASRAPSPTADPSGPLFYGPASAKVSEAALCWLARWGGDVLAWEREIDAQFPRPVPACSSNPSRSPSPSSTRSSRRRSDSLPTSSPRSEREPNLLGKTTLTPPPPPRPVIWAFDPALGLPSHIIRTLISSDSFYVPSEWHRYHVARDVVDWRRKGKRAYFPSRSNRAGPKDDQEEEGDLEDDPDEREYRQLFANGVYYTHMPFPQLSAIAEDICPLTGVTYTPEWIVHRALWEGMRLRTAVANPDTTSSLSVPLTHFAEKVETPATTSSLSRDQRYFPVPEDETAKSGDSLGQLMTTVSNLSGALAGLRVDLDDAVADAAGGSMGATGLAAQRDILALPVPLAQPVTPPVHKDPSLRRHELVERARERLASVPPEPGSAPVPEPNRPWRRPEAPAPTPLPDRPWRRPEHSEASPMPVEAWVPFEPMRFGVEFFSIDRIADRTRLYSPTVFYGGSWWNLYVVTVHKAKGIQLGIYLHRQNPNEDLPPISAPPDPEADKARLELAQGPPTLDPLEDLVPCPPPPKPYLDSRRSVRACFSIHCFSPIGNGLTRFSSGPDQFTLSQSWGWKSSSLLGAVFFSEGDLASLTSTPTNRFRCVCSIALV